MWRCARCGARNTRADPHCQHCGMASPFDDGGRTQTVQIPTVRRPVPPRRRRAVPWVAVAVLIAVLVAIALIGAITLAS